MFGILGSSLLIVTTSGAICKYDTAGSWHKKSKKLVVVDVVVVAELPRSGGNGGGHADMARLELKWASEIDSSLDSFQYPMEYDIPAKTTNKVRIPRVENIGLGFNLGDADMVVVKFLSVVFKLLMYLYDTYRMTQPPQNTINQINRSINRRQQSKASCCRIN